MVSADRLLAQVEAFLRREAGLRAGDLLLVAVSGGLDSVTLLHLLREIAPALDLRLHVAHLDHNLRGHAGRADASFVADLASEWGVPATLAVADVVHYRRQSGLSLEAAARAVRYAFLADLTRKLGARGVAVGHTADDQAETVLLHFLRGAGLAGLRGMLAVQTLPVHGAAQWRDLEASDGAAASLRVLRPLLATSRTSVAAYAAARGLDFRVDASNSDLSITRNRIRHSLLPQLETFNPGFKEAVVRSASLIADDYAYLEEAAAAAWAHLARVEGKTVGFALAEFQSRPLAVRRLLLRQAVARLLPEAAVTLGAGHVEAVLALATAGRTGATVALPGGLQAQRSYDTIVLLVGQTEVEPLPSEPVALLVPGTTKVGVWTVKARLCDAPCQGVADPLHVDFDLGRSGEGLVVRRRRPGDRVRLAGGGSKKLQDVFVDNKVPRASRDAVPVVAAGEVVIWAVGQTVDQLSRARADTGRILCLTFSKGAV
ncbi:MAG: tRNA lysidine(34) synthetase TilS [Chloroflexota bacterium]